MLISGAVPDKRLDMLVARDFSNKNQRLAQLIGTTMSISRRSAIVGCFREPRFAFSFAEYRTAT
jgi:hypothetical protein